MARRRKSREWSLNGKDPLAVPNARIALALLRAVRRLPGVVSSHSYDDLARVLQPVLADEPTEVRAALSLPRRGLAACVDSEDLDLSVPGLLEGQDVLCQLGEGLARRLSGFARLFNAVELRLEKFLSSHGHESDRNIDMLAEVVGLSALDVAYLRIASAFCYGSIDASIFSFADTQAKSLKAIEAMAQASGIEVVHLFDADRPLAFSGLLDNLPMSRSASLDDLMRLSRLGGRLLGVPVERVDQLSSVVLQALPPKPDGDLLHWPHLTEQHAILKAALRAALEQRVRGFNILLHGLPGTGKTEFARQLIAEMKGSGFVVAYADDQGNEASREERLASLRISQTFASHDQNAVLVLDEAEDIFQSDRRHPLARLFREGDESKAWINTLLESNPHPVIWISNEVGHMDSAYLRRFSLCVEFPRTPLVVRHYIAEQLLTPVGCGASLIEAVAANAEVSPAALAGAASFARLAADSGLGDDAVVRVVLNEHLKAAGHEGGLAVARKAVRFDLGYLNVEGNATPQRVLDALSSGAPAAVLFSGPPGTGKTQFASELAKRLGRRLVVKTSSDLYTKWYGESERNVARMFRDCDPKAEVLFLDEADVVLGARGAAGHRVDASVTAEFLRWMESFDGVFVCATNDAAAFDAAFARRFVFRLEFKPLSAAQRRAMFCELALEQASDRSGAAEAWLTQIEDMDGLTAGDFANVARRMKMLRLADSPKAWLTELTEEIQSKAPHGGKRIGFVR